jgi:hypothetical protein
MPLLTSGVSYHIFCFEDARRKDARTHEKLFLFDICILQKACKMQIIITIKF